MNAKDIVETLNRNVNLIKVGNMSNSLTIKKAIENLENLSKDITNACLEGAKVKA